MSEALRQEEQHYWPGKSSDHPHCRIQRDPLRRRGGQSRRQQEHRQMIDDHRDDRDILDLIPVHIKRSESPGKNLHLHQRYRFMDDGLLLGLF